MSWARRLPVPYPVLLAALGIVIGLVPGLPHLRLSSAVLLFGVVPPLVFQAALTLDQREARAVAVPITLLATAGVALTVVGVAAGVHYLLALPWAAALLLGAIVSPTDPIAVVAVIRGAAAPPRLAALLEGESLFNDGTGVAVFAAVAATIAGGSPSVAEFGARLLLITTIGAAAGILAGGAAAAISRIRPSLALPAALFSTWSGFALAQLLGGSGVIAVVVAGVLVARVGRGGPGLLRAWNVIAFALNAILFVAIGLAVPTAALLAMGGAAAVAYLVMVVARAVPVWLLTAGARFPWRWRQLAWWGGLRGALSIALALSLAGTRVSTLAYGMVVLSLLIQGGALRLFTRSLEGADAAEPEDDHAQ